MEIQNKSLNHRFVTLALIAATALAVTLAGGGFSPAAGQEPASRQALEIVALSATTDVSVLRRLDAHRLTRWCGLMRWPWRPGGPIRHCRGTSMNPSDSFTRACRSMAEASPGSSPLG